MGVVRCLLVWFWYGSMHYEVIAGVHYRSNHRTKSLNTEIHMVWFRSSNQSTSLSRYIQSLFIHPFITDKSKTQGI
jgi:hypothetical protein